MTTKSNEIINGLAHIAVGMIASFLVYGPLSILGVELPTLPAFFGATFMGLIIGLVAEVKERGPNFSIKNLMAANPVDVIGYMVGTVLVVVIIT